MDTHDLLQLELEAVLQAVLQDVLKIRCVSSETKAKLKRLPLFMDSQYFSSSSQTILKLLFNLFCPSDRLPEPASDQYVGVFCAVLGLEVNLSILDLMWPRDVSMSDLNSHLVSLQTALLSIEDSAVAVDSSSMQVYLELKGFVDVVSTRMAHSPDKQSFWKQVKNRLGEVVDLLCRSTNLLTQPELQEKVSDKLRNWKYNAPSKNLMQLINVDHLCELQRLVSASLNQEELLRLHLSSGIHPHLLDILKRIGVPEPSYHHVTTVLFLIYKQIGGPTPDFLDNQHLTSTIELKKDIILDYFRNPNWLFRHMSHYYLQGSFMGSMILSDLKPYLSNKESELLLEPFVDFLEQCMRSSSLDKIEPLFRNKPFISDIHNQLVDKKVTYGLAGLAAKAGQQDKFDLYIQTFSFADKFQKDYFDHTLPEYALLGGNCEIVQTVIKRVGQISFIRHFDSSLLSYAIKSESSDMVDFVMKLVNDDQKKKMLTYVNPQGNTVLMDVAAIGNPILLEKILSLYGESCPLSSQLNRYSSMGMSPLILASFFSTSFNAESVRLLLDRGAPPILNSQESMFESYCKEAARDQNSALLSLLASHAKTSECMDAAYSHLAVYFPKVLQDVLHTLCEETQYEILRKETVLKSLVSIPKESLMPDYERLIIFKNILNTLSFQHCLDILLTNIQVDTHVDFVVYYWIDRSPDSLKDILLGEQLRPHLKTILSSSNSSSSSGINSSISAGLATRNLEVFKHLLDVLSDPEKREVLSTFSFKEIIQFYCSSKNKPLIDYLESIFPDIFKTNLEKINKHTLSDYTDCFSDWTPIFTALPIHRLTELLCYMYDEHESLGSWFSCHHSQALHAALTRSHDVATPVLNLFSINQCACALKAFSSAELSVLKHVLDEFPRLTELLCSIENDQYFADWLVGNHPRLVSLLNKLPLDAAVQALNCLSIDHLVVFLKQDALKSKLFDILKALDTTHIQQLFNYPPFIRTLIIFNENIAISLLECNMSLYDPVVTGLLNYLSSPPVPFIKLLSKLNSDDASNFLQKFRYEYLNTIAATDFDSVVVPVLNRLSQSSLVCLLHSKPVLPSTVPDPNFANWLAHHHPITFDGLLKAHSSISKEVLELLSPNVLTSALMRLSPGMLDNILGKDDDSVGSSPSWLEERHPTILGDVLTEKFRQDSQQSVQLRSILMRLSPKTLEHILPDGQLANCLAEQAPDILPFVLQRVSKNLLERLFQSRLLNFILAQPPDYLHTILYYQPQTSVAGLLSIQVSATPQKPHEKTLFSHRLAQYNPETLQTIILSNLKETDDQVFNVLSSADPISRASTAHLLAYHYPIIFQSILNYQHSSTIKEKILNLKDSNNRSVQEIFTTRLKTQAGVKQNECSCIIS